MMSKGSVKKTRSSRMKETEERAIKTLDKIQVLQNFVNLPPKWTAKTKHLKKLKNIQIICKIKLKTSCLRTNT